MSKFVKRTLGLALVFIVVSGIVVYYCYGPILVPEIKRRWDYPRGWKDASSDHWGGRRAFTFQQYFVAGLQEHAKRVDGIEDVQAPIDVVWAQSYLNGYNDSMAPRLSRMLGLEFPNDYVDDYLKNGSLDISAHQPSECPVHKTAMGVETVPFAVFWPYTFSHPMTDRERASDELFPFPGDRKVRDGSLFPMPAFAVTRVCNKCREAEQKWILENGSPEW